MEVANGRNPWAEEQYFCSLCHAAVMYKDQLDRCHRRRRRSTWRSVKGSFGNSDASYPWATYHIIRCVPGHSPGHSQIHTTFVQSNPDGTNRGAHQPNRMGSRIHGAGRWTQRGAAITAGLCPEEDASCRHKKVQETAADHSPHG